MSRGLVKLIAGGAAVLALGAVLLVLVVDARYRGQVSYCRNNLRRLGTLAHKELAAAFEPPPERGRAFWQRIRELAYYNDRRKEWMRVGALNPFGCPVRGKAPLNLMELPDEEYVRAMSDPSTIDYRGPKDLGDSAQGPRLLGADRIDNHPSGGHVLFVDLSVRETERGGVTLQDWRSTPALLDRSSRETAE